MNIWNFFLTPNRECYRFRRKHAMESFAGKRGIFALTVIDEYSVRPLHFEAANDLGCLDRGKGESHPHLRDLDLGRTVGVSVCVLTKCTDEHLQRIASALNDTLSSESDMAA